jgi:hypothetical protein
VVGILHMVGRGALRGHLDRSVLASELERIEKTIPLRDARVLLDCREMTGYDLDARHAFVSWNERVRGRLLGVAILTGNPLWRMVIAAMSMASRVPMKPFADEQSALAWLERPSA